MPASCVRLRCGLLLSPLLLALLFSFSLSQADPALPQPGMKTPGPQDLHYVLELATGDELPLFHVNFYFRAMPTAPPNCACPADGTPRTSSTMRSETCVRPRRKQRSTERTSRTSKQSRIRRTRSFM